MNELTIVRILSDRPNIVPISQNIIPSNWIIFNAPRPLLGESRDYEWQGDFIHGVFYAAIDPLSQNAVRNIEENIKLDGWIGEYITINDIREWVKSSKYYDMVLKLKDVEKTIIQSYFINHKIKIINQSDFITEVMGNDKKELGGELSVSADSRISQDVDQQELVTENEVVSDEIKDMSDIKLQTIISLLEVKNYDDALIDIVPNLVEIRLK